MSNKTLLKNASMYHREDQNQKMQPMSILSTAQSQSIAMDFASLPSLNNYNFHLSFLLLSKFLKIFVFIYIILNYPKLT